ncbi:MAG: hypothetical protein ACRBCJ_04015 [Hyphomicrobiaceae bacterium]
MSKHDIDNADSEYGVSAGRADAAGTQNDLHDFVQSITGRLRTEEQRHAGALNQLMNRLSLLGAEAQVARFRVPDAYRPALENIQSGLQELSNRIADASGDNYVSEAPAASMSGDVNTDTNTKSAVTSDPYAPAALKSAPIVSDSAFVAGPTSETASGVDPFDVVSESEFDGQDPSSPWDAASAEALAQIYESGEAGEGELASALKASPPVAQQDTVFQSQDDADAQKQWLQDRFAEIANRIEGNGEPTAADIAIENLTERFDTLEARFSSAMEDVATKEDLGGLTIVEAHINELNQHLEETQDKFVKLDKIEAQLAAVIDRLSGENSPEQSMGAVQLPQEVVEEVAMAAAEKAALKLATTDQPDIAQNERMADLQNALHNFMDERRQGDVESQSMMATMQEAMSQMLDRVNAIEHGASHPEYIAQPEPALQQVERPVQYEQPAQYEEYTEPAAAFHDETPEEADLSHEMTQELELPQETEEESEKIKGLADSFEARMQEIIAQQQSEADQQAVVQAEFEPSQLAIQPEEQQRAEPYFEEQNSLGDESHVEVQPEAHLSSQQEPLSDDGMDVGYTGAQDVAPEPQFAPPIQEQPSQEFEQQPVEMAPVPSIEGAEPEAFEVPPAPEMPAAQIPEFDANQAAGEPSIEDTEQVSSAHSMVPPPPVPPRPQVSTADSISKMRQDLIANAQKAKLEAAAEAGRQMEETKKKKGLGLSLGFRKKSQEEEASTETGDEEETGKKGGLFGLAKRKLIVSMFIAVCTVPAFTALLETPTGSSLLADILQRPHHHRASENMGTGGEPAATRSDDVLAPAAVRPGAGPEKHLQSNGERRTVELSGGYQGEIIDDIAEAELTAAQLASQTPAGLTVYDSRTPVTRGLISHFEKRDDLAKRSAKLGKYSVPVMPAALATKTDEEATLQAKVSQPSINGNARNALGLPPAKVGPLSLRLAAAKGDASAQFQVGTRLAEGKGNAQDFGKAAQWFQRSAQQGFAQSQYRLGTLYERGLGVRKDIGRAKVWYQRAAEQGNLKSMHNMAVLSANPSQGRAPDYSAAADWFTKAANRGLADSQFNLAVLYENGLGVAKDLKRAYMYFALAAKSGDSEASRRRDRVIAMLEIQELAQAEDLVKRFKRLSSDRLANDALAAGQFWKKNSAGANYVN